MQDETKSTVDRRGLLRRAGTVAAAAGVAGAAGAVAATPAAATNGQTITHGGTFSGPANKTSIQGGTNTSPTLKLDNMSATGMPLELRPIVFPGGNSPIPDEDIQASPLGSVFVDDFGDMHAIGEGIDDEGELFQYDNMLYSPTWATMTIPVAPTRIVHTWPGHSGGRDLIVPGSADFDTTSFGRLLPRGPIAPGVYGPDIVIDLSDFLNPGFAALQANLTIGDATGGGGWAAMWPTVVQPGVPDAWPGSSSINFNIGSYVANFTQTLVGDLGRISIRVTRPVTLILDVCGFVVTDRFAQIRPEFYEFGGFRAAAKSTMPRRRGVPPRG